MPVLDGLGAIQQIRAVAPATRIVVLTTYDSDGDILRAVEAGATGYLLKDAPREELFKAIRAPPAVDDRTAAVTAAMEKGVLRLAK